MTQSPRDGSTRRDALISRRNLKDEVAEKIRDQIFRGELAPEARINQDKLAESWGTSKLPVREALISLEAEGLVTNVARRGSFVVPLTTDEVENHYHIYGLVAGFAAERAATRLTDLELRALDELNTNMAASAKSAEHESINFEFHRIIDRAAKSRRLNAVIRTLSRSMPHEFYLITPGWHEEALRDHKMIYEALRQRDGEAANRAMLDHVKRGGVRAAANLEAAWRRQT